VSSPLSDVGLAPNRNRGHILIRIEDLWWHDWLQKEKKRTSNFASSLGQAIAIARGAR
jgi:hypothetical protein